MKYNFHTKFECDDKHPGLLCIHCKYFETQIKNEPCKFCHNANLVFGKKCYFEYKGSKK